MAMIAPLETVGEVDSSLLCYCTDEHGCSPNRTCVRQSAESACFKWIKLETRDEEIVELHRYGCLPPEAGGSAFQCHGHLTLHKEPQSIACCFEGNLCNKNLEVPEPVTQKPLQPPSPALSHVHIVMLVGGVAVILVVLLVLLYYLYMKFAKQKDEKSKTLLDGRYQGQNKPLMNDVEKGYVWFDEASSGSGSGEPELVHRSIGRDVWNNIVATIGEGRYGRVYRARWRHDDVAVKQFNTTCEESWKREAEIYGTTMLRHENILGFIASDIVGTGSSTQMLLITEYHPLGSLYDYLKDRTLSAEEALRLAYSASCGLAHLHEEISGTKCKPAIAHRDLKSKNILVKAPGVAVIADFGLAVRYSNTGGLDVMNQMHRVGTKRYMAPEVLDDTIDKTNFECYKHADMYSFALVFWELTRRIQHDGIDAEQSSLAVVVGEVESDTSTKWTSLSTVTPKPYLSPFEEHIPSGDDPSFEKMKEIVCVRKIRPQLDDNWGHGTPLLELGKIINECWRFNSASRLTAVTVKKKLAKTIHELLEARRVASPASLPKQPKSPLAAVHHFTN